MSKIFFINSNIGTDKKDFSRLKDYQNAVAHNIGNSYPTWSLIKQIQGKCQRGELESLCHIQNIWNYDFANQEKDIDTINNECEHVFLILQDQIRLVEGYNQELPYENIINFIKKLNKKVVILSLGINQMHSFDSLNNSIVAEDLIPDFHEKLGANLVNFLKQIADYTEVIGVRGYYTQEVLSKLGVNNTQVIGCPSYYETGRDRVVVKKDYSEDLKTLFATAYNPFTLKRFPIQDLYDFDMVVQDEQKFMRVIYEPWRSLYKLKGREFKDFWRHKYNAFHDIESWKNFVSKYDFFFGIRIHGSIVALNSGVPALFIPPDVKGREMAEYLNIPHCTAFSGETDLEKIYEYCDYDKMNSEYNNLYDKYVQFLGKNDISIKS